MVLNFIIEIFLFRIERTFLKTVEKLKDVGLTRISDWLRGFKYQSD